MIIKKAFYLLTFTILMMICTQKVESATKEQGEWRVGSKIHFENKGGLGYMGIDEIGETTQTVLAELLGIKKCICPLNSKILLKKEEGLINLTFYEESKRPGVAEEMHATLLYTQPRGFNNSETLKQVCPVLFGSCEKAPDIEEVAKVYNDIIDLDLNFQISEIVLTLTESGPSFIIAKLLYEGCENIYKQGQPISAGLHLTLVNCAEDSIWGDQGVKKKLVEQLNKALKGKIIKVAKRNEAVDLEFGISGSSWRLRAGEIVHL